MKVPASFPPGSEFVASFSGDEFVAFPDGKVFKLADSGDELISVASLPSRGAPISEAKFLACAEGARKFAASKAAS